MQLEVDSSVAIIVACNDVMHGTVIMLKCKRRLQPPSYRVRYELDRPVAIIIAR